MSLELTYFWSVQIPALFACLGLILMLESHHSGARVWERILIFMLFLVGWWGGLHAWLNYERYKSIVSYGIDYAFSCFALITFLLALSLYQYIKSEQG